MYSIKLVLFLMLVVVLAAVVLQNQSAHQVTILVRDIMDDAQRDRLVSNVVGHLKKGVSEPLLERAFEYWRNIDKAIGDRVAKGVQGT